MLFGLLWLEAVRFLLMAMVTAVGEDELLGDGIQRTRVGDPCTRQGKGGSIR